LAPSTSFHRHHSNNDVVVVVGVIPACHRRVFVWQSRI
jgi:hypothetical protein